MSPNTPLASYVELDENDLFGTTMVASAEVVFTSLRFEDHQGNSGDTGHDNQLLDAEIIRGIHHRLKVGRPSALSEIPRDIQETDMCERICCVGELRQRCHDGVSKICSVGFAHSIEQPVRERPQGHPSVCFNHESKAQGVKGRIRMKQRCVFVRRAICWETLPGSCNQPSTLEVRPI